MEVSAKITNFQERVLWIVTVMGTAEVETRGGADNDVGLRFVGVSLILRPYSLLLQLDGCLFTRYTPKTCPQKSAAASPQALRSLTYLSAVASDSSNQVVDMSRAARGAK